MMDGLITWHILNGAQSVSSSVLSRRLKAIILSRFSARSRLTDHS